MATFTVTNLSKCILRVRQNDNHAVKHEILPGLREEIHTHPDQNWEFHARYSVKGLAVVQRSPIMYDLVISDELVQESVKNTKAYVARKANPKANVNGAKARAAQ